jgi:2-polyprenyl-3-methyl-5-hydroxy-6-metoxy-1,4-benzoquinol methylase
MISIDQCPVCGGTDFTPLYTAHDSTVSHETFSIKACTHCHLGITSPRPDNENLSRYYQSENYISHSGNSSGLTAKMYLTARRYTLQWKRRIVENYCGKGAVLDIGCGTGEFLSVMQQNNWEVAGIEPSLVGRTKAESLIGKKVVPNLESITLEKVNAITLWHVLEHIVDLGQTLESIHRLLEPRGTVFIAVPNYLSADAKYYKEHWAGLDVPRHLWHFTKESMALLLKQNGFILRTIVPMKLDSFYISLLSERNKGKSTYIQLTSGFLQGLISNINGRRTANHSSLIYIANAL